MPTYMKCRIMHVEVTHTLDTDSFIMAFMRFITQRENVKKKKIQFFSIRNQLIRALEEMDNQNLQAFMQAFIVDWVKKRRSPFSVSYMRGVLEEDTPYNFCSWKFVWLSPYFNL